MDVDIPLRVVGVVRSSHKDLDTTPIQAGVNRAEQGVIELEPGFEDGLDGLAEFDCAWMLTWLHRHASREVPPLRQVPFLLRSQRRLIGIFACRAPRRVNPIGLSLIQIVDIAPRG